METNDAHWRKGSLGFLPIPAKSGRTDSLSLSFPLSLARVWVSLTYVGPMEAPMKPME